VTLAIRRAAVATIPVSPVRAIITAVAAVTASTAIPAKTPTPAITASTAIPVKAASASVAVRPTGPVTISPGPAWPVRPAAEAPGRAGRTRTERSSGGRPGAIGPVTLGPVAGCPVLETAFPGAAIAGITRAVAEAIPAGAPARPAIPRRSPEAGRVAWPRGPTAAIAAVPAVAIRGRARAVVGTAVTLTAVPVEAASRAALAGVVPTEAAALASGPRVVPAVRATVSPTVAISEPAAVAILPFRTEPLSPACRRPIVAIPAERSATGPPVWAARPSVAPVTAVVTGRPATGAFAARPPARASPARARPAGTASSVETGPARPAGPVEARPARTASPVETRPARTASPVETRPPGATPVGATPVGVSPVEADPAVTGSLPARPAAVRPASATGVPLPARAIPVARRPGTVAEPWPA
jgi:hypothetical protein